MVTINEHDPIPPSTARASAWQVVRTVLAPVASLKLTVALLGLSIFLVLAGTLAQTEKDIWEVMGQYFRCLFARVELSIFFPKAWFPKLHETAIFRSLFPGQIKVPGYFWFPGGFLIGGLMGLNLLAAHAMRFTFQVRGKRLLIGLAVLAAGMWTTWLVIATNDNTNGLQAVSSLGWQNLWLTIKYGLALLSALGICASVALVAGCVSGYAETIQASPRRFLSQTVLVSVVSAALTAGTIMLFRNPQYALGASEMRILWQLMQGGFAGLVLLAGCILLFRKRAGIVLLHGGIALMMANELVVASHHVEGQMRIREGETVNYVQDIRTAELAVIDGSDPDEDRVTVVPVARLKKLTKIEDPALPFDLKPMRFIQNAGARKPKPGETNPATQGSGRDWILDEQPPGTGVDSNSKVDQPAVYVEALEKGRGKSLGVYAVALGRSLHPERIRVKDRTYDLVLRFKRTYKPWSVTLNDVRADMYVGTKTPRNYSSDIVLNDPSRNVHDRPIRIWMNNPLRFAGETFYQSQFDVEPHGGQAVEVTGLQVVKNTGWMIPYVACMIVAVGMLAQFLITLARFLQRREAERLATASKASRVDEASKQAVKSQPPEEIGFVDPPAPLVDVLFPAAFVTVMAVFVILQTRIPEKTDEGLKLHEFGQIPVIYQGRVKPLDTIARNSLRIISNRESFYVKKGDREVERPAIRWLLDLMADVPDFEKHRVLKIDSPEVLATLNLKSRAHYLYALEEIRPQIEEFNKQVREANELRADQLSPYQRKLLEVDRRIRSITLLQFALRESPITLPTEREFQENRGEAMQRIQMFMQFLKSAPRSVREMQVPLVVPLQEENEKGKTAWVWKPLSLASAEAMIPRREPVPKPEPVRLYEAMLHAYRSADATGFNKASSRHVNEFNSALNGYRSFLKEKHPDDINLPKVEFEADFNHALPFYWGGVYYVIAFVLAVASWLGWQKPLNRASFWLIAFTLLIHTAGLLARIYISGRPPVTNLYSSAVFISWGCVLLGLGLEWFFGQSLGNIVASVTGFAGLIIGHLLSADGDTFTVLQAVLDTQFWLATHVVCISLGYATTFLAGFLAIQYVARGILLPALTSAFGGPPAPTRGNRLTASHGPLGALFEVLHPADVDALRRKLGKMIYGILCFAIFFSFVGTVLGGLWADDSWGRFWGWDPKENGALIIVLWNALVLHARWDKLVGDRGLAVLALGGNICTAWSWFGVNELGVGLHSYGFTEGVLFALAMTVLAHLALIAVGLLPKTMWSRA